MNPQPRVGLVLSGGGARAAYEVGVLRSIYGGTCPAAKSQPAPEVFCGTGAGAFNAAVIASRLPGQRPTPVDYLSSLWADEIPREGKSRHNRVYRKRLDTKQFLDLGYMWNRPFRSWVQYLGDCGMVLPELGRRTWNAVVKRNWSSWLNLAIWHDTAPMRRLITESVSLETIRNGELPGGGGPRVLRVVATERGAGTAQVFRNADFAEDVGHDLILASCALPIIFPSVTIKGKDYFYGGLVMQTPLQPAIDAGCTVIHLMHNEPKHDKPMQQEEPNTMEMLNRTVAVALSATLERDLDVRRRVNQLLGTFDTVKKDTGVEVLRYLNGDGRFRKVVVHQYRPKKVLGGKRGFLNFTRGPIEEAIELGDRDARAHDCEESGCIL